MIWTVPLLPSFGLCIRPTILQEPFLPIRTFNSHPTNMGRVAYPHGHHLVEQILSFILGMLLLIKLVTIGSQTTHHRPSSVSISDLKRRMMFDSGSTGQPKAMKSLTLLLWLISTKLTSQMTYAQSTAQDAIPATIWPTLSLSP